MRSRWAEREPAGPVESGPGTAPAWALPACLAAALLLTLPFLSFLTDDTYIHFQFVKNLLLGHGYAFNAGEPIGGDTSPLWVFLLAAVARFIPGATSTPAGADTLPVLAWIAKGTAALALLASVALFPRLGRRLGWDGSVALLPAALLAAHGWSARWALSGLETSLAILLVVLALDSLAAALLDGRGHARAGLFLGLAFLTRPECLLFAGLGAAAVLAGSDARRLRRAGTLLLGFTIPVGPWLGAAWLWFHRLLPTSVAAKASGGWDLERVLAAVRHSIRDVLACDAIPVAFAIAALALAHHPRLLGPGRGRRVFWLLVALWPPALVGILAAGGTQVVSRYLLPAVPCVLLLGAASLRWALATARPRIRPLLSAGFLAAFVGQNAVLIVGWAAPQARVYAADLQSSLAWLGVWARERTPAGTLFATPDIGAFAFYSDRPVLDLFGLMTPELAPIVVREGYDAVVERLLFESAGRPSYLIDRSRESARLTRPADPQSPYRLILTRRVGNLGITRPGPYYYSLYAIDWPARDMTREPRVAGAAAFGPPILGASAFGRAILGASAFGRAILGASAPVGYP